MCSSDLLAGLGGQGAATVAGIMLAALCVAGLPCVLLIAKAHPEASQKLTCPKGPPPVMRRYLNGRINRHEC